MTEGKAAFLSFAYVVCIVIAGPILVFLKLIGLLSLPWVWILSPWWIPSAIVAFFVFLYGAMQVMMEVFERLSSDK